VRLSRRVSFPRDSRIVRSYFHGHVRPGPRSRGVVDISEDSPRASAVGVSSAIGTAWDWPPSLALCGGLGVSVSAVRLLSPRRASVVWTHLRRGV